MKILAIWIIVCLIFLANLFGPGLAHKLWSVNPFKTVDHLLIIDSTAVVGFLGVAVISQTAVTRINAISAGIVTGLVAALVYWLGKALEAVV